MRDARLYPARNPMIISSIGNRNECLHMYQIRPKNMPQRNTTIYERKVEPIVKKANRNPTTRRTPAKNSGQRVYRLAFSKFPPLLLYEYQRKSPEYYSYKEGIEHRINIEEYKNSISYE